MKKFILFGICILILLTAISASAQSSTPVPIGLAEWWTADNNALGVRHRHNGTLQNGANYVSGKVGNAFSFDGNNDYVSVPKTNALNFGTGDFSVEFWVKWNNISNQNNQGMMSGDNFGEAGDYNGWLFNNDGNSGGIGLLTRKASVGNANARIAASNFTNGVWYHLAGVRTGRTLQLYVNGVLATTDTESAPIDVSNNYEIRIGSLSAAAPQFFDGQIDEPAIYDRALSANEVQAIFNAGSAGKSKPTATVAPDNQVLWFAGDGNANDSAGTNNGTLQNGAGFAVGKVGQSFNLDGFDDFINIPDSPSLEVTNQLTLEAWIYPNDVNDYRQIISKFGASGNYAYQFGLAPNGSLRADLSQTGGPAYEQLTSPPNSITANAWNHIAVTFNGGTTILYVNGVQIANANLPISTIFDGGNTNVNIGRDSFGGQNFVGQIDEPSIYNRALTADEIASIYNAGQAGKLKQTTTTGTTSTVGDVTLTYANAAMRRTQVVPLDEIALPALPAGMDSTGLFYDIATDIIPTSTTNVCFNLPSFGSLSMNEFTERRILHLENGIWINRTSSHDFINKIICADVSSFSPFAIVDSNLTPTAANVSIAGRVMDDSGRGIQNVRVSITNANGEVRSVLSNSFGYYSFDKIPTGQNYILSVFAKKYQFSPPTQIVFVSEEIKNVNFRADLN